MQPRLTRSRTDVMVAGVCGGLGEYFNIDPVIVRLIFVLITLTSGVGLPVYCILWLLMPKAPAAGDGAPFPYQQAPQLYDESARMGQPSTFDAAQQEQEAREVLIGQRTQVTQPRVAPGPMGQRPPAGADYRFDPLTGQPIQPDKPATGETLNLHFDPAQLPAQSAQAQPAPRRHSRPHNWGSLGTILIGIGGLILLQQLTGMSMSFLFPLLLIAAGFILLTRKR